MTGETDKKDKKNTAKQDPNNLDLLFFKLDTDPKAKLKDLPVEQQIAVDASLHAFELISEKILGGLKRTPHLILEEIKQKANMVGGVFSDGLEDIFDTPKPTTPAKPKAPAGKTGQQH